MKFKAIFLLSLVIIGYIYSSTPPTGSVSGTGSGSGSGKKGSGSGSGSGSGGKGPKKKAFDANEKKSFGKFSF